MVSNSLSCPHINSQQNQIQIQKLRFLHNNQFYNCLYNNSKILISNPFYAEIQWF